MKLNKWSLIVLGLTWIVIGLLPPAKEGIWTAGLVLFGIGMSIEGNRE